MRFLKYFLSFLAVLLLLFSSCQPADEETPGYDLDKLAGKAKPQLSWGTRTEDIPNNIGNTFTACPQTTRTITWQSKSNEGEVLFSNKRYPSTVIDIVDSYLIHRVDINGLKPGETYRYIAGSKDAYSPVYTFTTESVSEGSFTILHVTDPQITNQTEAAVWKRVIENAVKEFPETAFIVNTGDVIEDKIESRIPFYFDYAQEVKANYAFMYSLGNNDNIQWYNKHFFAPVSDISGTPGSTIYSFEYGNVVFINVDSNIFLGSAQLNWIENILKTSNKKWKVAMTHRPNYGYDEINTALTKLFDQYNVDLVLAGHWHFYGRSKPIDTDGNDKVNGTVWTIPNAAGTKYLTGAGKSHMAKEEQPNLPMFTKFEFTAGEIVLEAYTVNVSGEVALFDSYTIKKDD